jgi:two-component system chemotaxis response regulator CheB
MRVVPAIDGSRLESRTIYVAPADRHLMLDESGIRLTRGPKECRSRPAVDALFRSAAIAYGSRVIGIILSGMLDDGTAGLWAVKDRGGIALVQEPADAAYDGMATSAITHVVIDEVAPVARLAQRLVELVGVPVDPPEHAVLPHHAVETAIAMTGEGLKAGVMDLGRVSKYTCPDCHGVLVQIDEGPIVRFRCHTGHAFSPMTLIAEVNAAIDDGLWDTLRAIEERILLLRQMAALALPKDATQGARWREQADDAESRLAALRDMVLDPSFFGHDPEG